MIIILSLIPFPPEGGKGSPLIVLPTGAPFAVSELSHELEGAASEGLHMTTSRRVQFNENCFSNKQQESHPSEEKHCSSEVNMSVFIPY